MANDDAEPYIVVAFSTSHGTSGKGIRLTDPGTLLPIKLNVLPIEFTIPPLAQESELLYTIPIGLLFAYAYKFSPLILDGFKVDTSAGWMNLPNSEL